MRTNAKDNLSEDEWEKVFEQIAEDVRYGDFTALFEILNRLPPNALISYVDEEREATS